MNEEKLRKNITDLLLEETNLTEMKIIILTELLIAEMEKENNEFKGIFGNVRFIHLLIAM